MAYSYFEGQAVKTGLLPDGLYQVRTCQGHDDGESRLMGSCDNLVRASKEHQTAPLLD